MWIVSKALERNQGLRSQQWGVTNFQAVLALLLGGPFSCAQPNHVERQVQLCLAGNDGLCGHTSFSAGLEGNKEKRKACLWDLSGPARWPRAMEQVCL